MKIALFLILFYLCIGCNTSSDVPPCEEFRKSILAKDTGQVKLQMLSYIDQLTSDEYNQANLKSLATLFKNQCGYSVGEICFNCIKTNPPQTELVLTIESNPVVHKTFDFIESDGGKIVLLTMHD